MRVIKDRYFALGFSRASAGHEGPDHLDEYSSANIVFHQGLIRLSG